ncbi:MAG TPA: nucleotidyltransferase family protein [Rhizomicrobium sp.]
MPHAPSEQLRRLAALVRAPLLGESVPEDHVDPKLVNFAIRRHRVGPLLHIALQSGRPAANDDDLAQLAQHYRANAIQVAATELLLRNVASLYSAAGIPWLAFKGLALARQLYPKPAWRHSNDVDILVPPDCFAGAMRALKGDGFVIVNTTLHPEHIVERLVGSLAKDIMLRQAKSGISVELHRRLFFARTEEARFAPLADAFKPRLSLAALDVPIPPAGAGQSLYLLIHGASSRWFRLKWLTDLLPLMRGMDAAQMSLVADTAERMKAAVTVKATFKLLRCVFGEISFDPMQAWLDEPAGRRLVDARLAAYLEALDDPEAMTATRPGDQFDSLNLYYAMMDNAGYRAAVLTRGAAWTALKTLRRLL